MPDNIGMLKSIFKHKKPLGLLAFTGAVLFFSVMQTIILHRLGWSWSVSIMDSTLSFLSLVFYGIDLILIFAYYQPSKSNRYYRFIFILVFTILNSITVRFLVDWMHIDVIGYSEFLFLSMPIRSAFTLLLLSFVTVMSWLMNELENQRQQEKRRVDTEQMIKEAELGLLRQKLQPHFLFNSLNSISALAISQPDEARNMIHQLSDFLRGTMKKDDQEFVKFDEEIKHLQLYLEIEKVRFGHRLIVDMNIASEALSKMVPPLIMQPIVENAIKFGLYGTLEETMIKIEANLEGSYLVIKTENPFDADSQGNSSGTGFGLTSIQRRLFLLFARQDLLKTDKKEKSFTTILRIPQKS